MSTQVVTTGYTTGVSKPGSASGGDDLDLFLTEFGELVLEAWDEVNKFEKHTYQRNTTKGKSDTFPIIGRKRDAFEHVPGSLITGGTVEHNEVEISLDPILVDSAFIAEIDELIAHYELRAPYARQLAESLSVVYDRRIAILTVLGARDQTPDYTDGPVGKLLEDNDYTTDADAMAAAMFDAATHIKERDIGGGQMRAFWRPKQYYLLTQSQKLDSVQWTGTANIAEGTVKRIAGIDMDWSNHIPNANITTGNTKYRGDFRKTVGIVSNPMAVGTLNRRGLKVNHLPQPDRLGHLLIASRACGHGVLRKECAVEVKRVDNPV
jgi:hypothetical protein